MNALMPIEVTELGIVIEVKPVASRNACCPIVVIVLPSAKVIVDRFVVPLNAFQPIEVTELGIMTEVRDMHS
ncbi:MAG: hypothetical protein FWD49_07550 [Firmicutes bacterium]|nr:hypothetical protein [Bacillota bacterium]